MGVLLARRYFRRRRGRLITWFRLRPELKRPSRFAFPATSWRYRRTISSPEAPAIKLAVASKPACIFSLTISLASRRAPLPPDNSFIIRNATTPLASSASIINELNIQRSQTVFGCKSFRPLGPAVRLPYNNDSSCRHVTAPHDVTLNRTGLLSVHATYRVFQIKDSAGRIFVQRRNHFYEAALHGVSPCFRFFYKRSADFAVVSKKCIGHMTISTVNNTPTSTWLQRSKEKCFLEIPLS